MIALSKQRTRRLVAVHGWSAVVFGLFLYVVILTGAIAVFSQEIGIWSAGGKRVAEPMAQEIDSVLRDLLPQVPEAYLEDVGVWGSAAGNLVAWFHTHKNNPDSGQIEDYGKLIEIDLNNGSVLASYEGWGEQVFHANPVSALDDFIVDLHVNLHAPSPWGLYATGILGFVMLVAAISGLLMHRHMIKDVFLSPRRDNPGVAKRDRHVLAGTWSLLFSFILGFTGAFFSFAGALGLPLVAVTAFGGDQVAMIETLVGAPQVEDATPAPMANLDAMKAQSSALAKSIPTFISIQHWGRADAQVQIFHPAPAGHLNGSTHVFAGGDGGYKGTKPQLGNAPSAGNAVFSLMGPLHFGHFAGVFSKIIWVCLGLASCYVIASGMRLWLQKRSKQLLWQRLGRGVDMTVYGTPIGLAGAAHAFFFALTSGNSAHGWTALGFLGWTAVVIFIGWVLPWQRVNIALKVLLALLLLALPIARLLCGGPDWFTALEVGDIAVVGIDLLMLAAGVFYLVCGFAVNKTQAWLPRSSAEAMQ